MALVVVADTCPKGICNGELPRSNTDMHLSMKGRVDFQQLIMRLQYL